MKNKKIVMLLSLVNLTILASCGGSTMLSTANVSTISAVWTEILLVFGDLLLACSPLSKKMAQTMSIMVFFIILNSLITMYEDTKKICHYVGMVHICTKKSLGVEETEGFCKGILQ